MSQDPDTSSGTPTARNRRTSALIGLLAAGLGLVVMVGWHTRDPRLTQVLPGLTAMVYNTAISFVALGAALLALGMGRRRVAEALAIGAAALSLITLAEYVGGVSLGVDELLIEAGTSSPSPGRMAPNTALSLLILAIAVLLACRAGRPRWRATAIALMASPTVAIGAISLVGYSTGFNTFGWGRFIPMALNTAVGLTLVGAGLLTVAWREDPTLVGLPSWLYLVVTITAAVMSVSMWQAAAARERMQADHAIQSALSEVKEDLVTDMRFRIAALARSARRWEHKGQPREQDWQFEARLLLTDVPGYTAIAWVDPRFQVRWVYLSENNRELLHADLGHDTKRRIALELARRQRAPAFTGPLALLNGGRGIDVYVPIYRGEQFDGYIAGRFEVHDLFSSVVQPSMAPGYAIEILDGSERLYVRSPQYQPLDSEWGREISVPLWNTHWTVRVWPTAEALALVESSIPQVALASGLMLSLLLGLAVYLAQSAWLRARVTERLKEGLEKEMGERRRAEQELDQFFTLSLDMLCIAGLDGHFRRLSEAWTRNLGWSLDELRTEPYASFIHPEDMSRTAEAVDRQEQGASVISFENRYRAKDGSYRWLRWNSTPAPDRRLIYAAARDVTSEKEAADALRHAKEELEEKVRQRTADLEQTNQSLHQREEFFRRLFEDSPFGAAVVGPDHKLHQVNRAFCELLGYTVSELAALTVEEMTDPEDLDAGAQLLEQMIGGAAPNYHLPKRFIRKNGEIVWAELTTTAIRDQQGAVLAALFMVENVTGRRRREEQIARLNLELEERIGQLTELNQELESFNYSISHDLRAPLRHLDGFSRILLDEYGTTLCADARNCARRIRDAARRMGRMVDELLELSRTSRREPDKQLTGLRSLVDDVLAEMQPELHDREIVWRIGNLPFIECDPTLTRQIFANLLSNGVKFSGTRKPAVIEVGCSESAGGPVLFVRDNGVGFNMKYADKLFGVFQRLHRREDFEGTGVGLATVQRIVHKHGGRIWAEAEVEKGAAFYFTLAPTGQGPRECGSELTATVR